MSVAHGYVLYQNRQNAQTNRDNQNTNRQLVNEYNALMAERNQSIEQCNKMIFDLRDELKASKLANAILQEDNEKLRENNGIISEHGAEIKAKLQGNMTLNRELDEVLSATKEQLQSVSRQYDHLFDRYSRKVDAAEDKEVTLVSVTGYAFELSDIVKELSQIIIDVDPDSTADLFDKAQLRAVKVAAADLASHLEVANEDVAQGLDPRYPIQKLIAAIDDENIYMAELQSNIDNNIQQRDLDAETDGPK